jgi:NAD(P)-dependent dehydrogenase (short-subunit alcohol dehydrogenase family)
MHAVAEAVTSKFVAQPDVLCNKAGGGESRWFESGPEAEWHNVKIWRRYVELNLNLVYIVSKEIVPGMITGAPSGIRCQLRGCCRRRFWRIRGAQGRRNLVHPYAGTTIGSEGDPGQCGSTWSDLHEDWGGAGCRRSGAVLTLHAVLLTRRYPH